MNEIETIHAPFSDPGAIDPGNIEAISDLDALHSKAASQDTAIAEGTNPEAVNLERTSELTPESLIDSNTWFDERPPVLEPLTDLIGSGGPVLIILAILSVMALTIILAKLYQFTRLQLNAREPVATALALWYRGDAEAALTALGDNRQPRARLLAHAISCLGQIKDQPPAALELVREEVTRAASAQLEQLRTWLRALEVIAALSPLLGLLGTVLGMIEAFRQLELAGSQVDPAILSGGIWQALLTTAVGLSVAIPVVFAHNWLDRRVERCAHGMEDAVTRLFTHAILPMGEKARSFPGRSASAELADADPLAKQAFGDAA